MAARVEQRLYRNAYYQGTMSDDNAACILQVIQSEKFPALMNCIWELTDAQVTDLISIYETWEAEHGSIENIIDTFDYTKIVKGELRDYQTIGTAFMFYAGSALLGDEVGLGKTVEVAGLCNLVRALHKRKNKPFSFCFLTEKTPAGQIREKLVKFTGSFVGLLPNGEAETVENWVNANKNGQNYSIVGTHALLNNSDFILYCVRHPFSIFIIDESALLKNKNNATYTNAAAILSKQDRKILLNATPLEKAVREFYNQLALLDKGYMPTVQKFEADFCKKRKQGHGFEIYGTKNEALFQQAVSLRYLARTRKMLGAEYEDNDYGVYIIEMCRIQRELMRRSSLYQMIYDFPPMVDFNVEKTLDNIPKARVTISLLQEMKKKNADDKALVYCHYVEAQQYLIEALEANGLRCAIINGKTKEKERAKIINAFNNENAYDVIITNVKRGLDLNICKVCIMYTLDTNPQKMVQVEGRMTRDFDVCCKRMYLLAMSGREEKALETSLKDRVSMADNMTTQGNSMVMSAIRSNENRVYVATNT